MNNLICWPLNTQLAEKNLIYFDGTLSGSLILERYNPSFGHVGIVFRMYESFGESCIVLNFLNLS